MSILDTIKHEVQFQGFKADGKWDHYSWRFVINGEAFEYRTGKGHATPQNLTDRRGNFVRRNKRPEGDYIVDQVTHAWVKVPTLHSVLECLIMDAECAQDSFDDFCVNMGYETDSRKALDTYLLCQSSGVRLRKAIKHPLSEISKEIAAMEEQ